MIYRTETSFMSPKEVCIRSAVRRGPLAQGHGEADYPLFGSGPRSRDELAKADKKRICIPSEDQAR